MLLRQKILIAAGALVAAGLALPAAAAETRTCPAFPYVPWWGEMTHESVTKAVNTQYRGDWKPVIGMLSGELDKMVAMRGRGEPYKVPNSTRQLGGDQLAVYIDKTRLAVDILKCLSGRDSGASAETVRPSAGNNDTPKGRS